MRANEFITKHVVTEGEESDLRRLQQQWWVALPAIMKQAGIEYHPEEELDRGQYYPRLGWIPVPGDRFTTFNVSANPKGDAAKLNIHVDVDTSNEFYRTAQPERAAKLNAVAEKIAQALGGTAAEHMTGQRKNHPGVSRITATMTLPKEPEEWKNPSRGYDPKTRFLNQPGERARQGRVARSAYSDTFGGDSSNYRLESASESEEQFCEECGGSLAEAGKASRALCKSSRSNADLGVSQLASCKSQGLRARETNKKHTIGNKRVKIKGKQVKGHKYGGPLPYNKSDN